MLADRAYNANSLCELIVEQGGEPVIPPRRHRKLRRHRLQTAMGVEGFFAKLQQWRRIATRYEKIAGSFLGFIKLDIIMPWLKC